MELLMLYQTICCPGHSWASFKCGNHWLKRDEDYVVPCGKRITILINQKKVLKAWHRVFGPIDYSNRQERDRNGDNAYIADDRVLHPKFGKGTVIGRTINPEDGRDRVQVLFDSGCDKWLALKYARLLLLDKNSDQSLRETEHMRCLQRKPEPEPLCEPEEATLENLQKVLSRWEAVAGYIESGIDDDSDEYTFDLSFREELHGILNGLASRNTAVPDVLNARIGVADKRFIELTCEIESNAWGSSAIYDRAVFWYYYRWPIK